jgi:hypothetical protein
LLRELEIFLPDAILIELPSDTEALLDWAGHKKMIPPVALLVYDPKNFQRAAYLPFAEFSPEWQAILFGLKNDIPVRPMDLPMSLQLGRHGETEEAVLFDQGEERSPEALRMRLDPLGYLAELSGFTDSERWWEHTFEREEQPGSIFEAISEMMETLRSELGREESRETLLREAFMRKSLRNTVKDGFKRIAIVCGAWHVPAIQVWESRTAKSDNALLRGQKKVKTQATWIPWAYNRLARSGGYAAGVISPAWYEILFRKKDHSHIEWMSRAARLLRSEDLSASAAHAVEASRLAQTLSSLRGYARPGLEELQESAQAVFTMGESFPMQLIHDRLVIGDRLGRVPRELPGIPLQKDFEQEVKSARLSKEVATTVALTKELDLRKESNRKASLLLHRLRLLDIPWGKVRSASEEQKGGFKEIWRLKWKAEFSIRLIEAGMWGNTVREATNALVKKKGQDAASLAAITTLLNQVLPAELPDALESLLHIMEEKAALSDNLVDLLDAIPALVQVLRYGDTRGTDLKSVRNLLQHSLPRLFIGLPGLVSQVEEEFARQLFQKLVVLNHSISLLGWEETEGEWLSLLQGMNTQPMVCPLIRGFATRLLFDRQKLSARESGRLLSMALSDPYEAPHWLEGFLSGSGLLLIHQPVLWSILNEWIGKLEPDRFQDLLPLLRRTFSRFSFPERQRMMALAGRKDDFETDSEDDFDPDRLARILPSIRRQL